MWVVWSYGGGEIVLRGYDARTLAQVASVPVPAIGGVSNLAAGRAGRRARRQALRGRGRHRGHRGPGRPPGDAPDLPDRGPGQLGGGLARRQQAVRRGGPFRVVPAAGLRRRHRQPGVLVPDVGRRCREPGRDRRRRLGHDGHRDERVGLVRPGWRPGSGPSGSARARAAGSVRCRSTAAAWSGSAARTSSSAPARPPASALARTSIPTDHGVVEYFDSPTVLSSGHAYALYQDNAAQLAGVASLTPPAACSG